MLQKKITIAGKEVTLGYSFATEIIYKGYTAEDVSAYINEAVTCMDSETPRMPDVKKSICLILAAAIAYAQSINQDADIKDTDLMNDATPKELATAIAEIIMLWRQFYTLPLGEKKEKGSEENPKN